MGVRGRLFVVTLVLIAIVDLLVGVYLEHELRGSLNTSIRAELTRHANSARALMNQAGTPIEVARADAVADTASEATSARITIVLEDGTVVGDSELTPAEVATIESHADRPEIRDALARDVGSSVRFSETLGAQMLYVAVPLDKEPHRIAIRAALPLQRIDEAVGSLRTAVAAAGLIALMVASIILVLLSKFVSRTLQTVMTAAQAVASGTPLPSGRSAGGRGEDSMSGSIQRMAVDLENTMGMLAAERNRFEAVLQSMDQAVLALDSKGRITTVNRAARELLDLREDVEGLKLLEAVRLPGLKRLVTDARPGRSATAEFDIPGSRRVEARATGQSDGGVVLVVLDVTAIRRLERVRRDFVANVSHELRTPIAVIRANTETLLAGAIDQPDRAKTFVDAVLRHSERLGRLVSDLLDISRIEAGRFTLKPTVLNVGDAVDHVMDLVAVEAESKGINLAVDVPRDLSLKADRKALEQVLINLVTNAVKYTQDDGHVHVTAQRIDDQVRFEVLDDGPGIDPAHRERIFERFYRVDPGRSRDMGGTGLGLSIVKHLIDAMEGEVGVEARSPKGSNFWFTVGADGRHELDDAANDGPDAAVRDEAGSA